METINQSILLKVNKTLASTARIIFAYPTIARIIFDVLFQKRVQVFDHGIKTR